MPSGRRQSPRTSVNRALGDRPDRPRPHVDVLARAYRDAPPAANEVQLRQPSALVGAVPSGADRRGLDASRSSSVPPRATPAARTATETVVEDDGAAGRTSPGEVGRKSAAGAVLAGRPALPVRIARSRRASVGSVGMSPTRRSTVSPSSSAGSRGVRDSLRPTSTPVTRYPALCEGEDVATAAAAERPAPARPDSSRRRADQEADLGGSLRGHGSAPRRRWGSSVKKSSYPEVVRSCVISGCAPVLV